MESLQAELSGISNACSKNYLWEAEHGVSCPKCENSYMILETADSKNRYCPDCGHYW